MICNFGPVYFDKIKGDLSNLTSTKKTGFWTKEFMLFAAQSILIIKMYNFVFGGTELAVDVDTIEW